MIDLDLQTDMKIRLIANSFVWTVTTVKAVAETER